MSNHKCLFIFLTLIYCSVLFSQNGTESGLLFQSFNVNKDKRTSLHLSSEGQFTFSDYYSVEFDLKLQDIDDKFGYICRVILGDELNYDLMLNNPTPENVSLFLVAEKNNLYKLAIKNSIFKPKEWNHVKFIFEKKSKTFTFQVNNQSSTFQKQNFPAKNEIDVCFGINQKAPFVTVDVAPVIIKNVAVSYKPNKIKYLWKLDKHGVGVVSDELQNLKAAVLNPQWIIDSHLTWKHRKQLKFPLKVFPVYNGSNTLFIVCENKIISHNLLNNSMVEYPFEPSIPVYNIANQFIYDSAQHQIVYSDFDSGVPVTSAFNFKTKKWSSPIVHLLSPAYQHNNNFFSPVDSSYFQIFGYGYHSYKADIKLISKSGEFTTKSFSPKITPRYLSAAGIKDSLLYVYGGIGNQNGRQEYGSELYNDLYVVNLRTLGVTKKWSKNALEKSEIAARTIVIDSTGKKGLVLMFNPTRFKSYLILNEIDLQEPNLHSLADTIPYFFQDNRSEASLYYSKQAQKLFTVTVHLSENNEYFLNVYDISFPVFSSDEVLQSSSKKYFSILFIGIALVLLALGLFLWFRKRSSLKVTKTHLIVNDHSLNELIFIQEKEQHKPGIYLLGGFRVINRHNHDITGEFTPLMKVLLCIIILYTCKNERGISSGKLKEVLWYDKSDESARNNRSVFISKIRILLSTIANIEILNDNSFWTIDYKEDAFCDYAQSITLIRNLQRNSNVNPEQLMGILAIISSGELLPNIQEDWLDNFKSEYSNLVIDVLLSIKDNKNLQDNHKLLIIIADTILKFDTLNEDAILLKCKSLVKLGRIKIAKDFFEAFRKEYKTIMNEDVYTSFENFLKK